MRPYTIWLASVIGSALGVDCTNTQSLPIIDLGYTRHQALSFNESTGIYLFQNIRYARSPTGDLRFRAPTLPLPDRHNVHNGSEERTCPQGSPDWQGKAYAPIGKFTTPGVEFNMSEWIEAIRTSTPRNPSAGPVTEDCLFLDVYVPKDVLRRANQRHFGGVPVLFWVHGGGYVLSSKVGYPVASFYPDSLMAKAAAESAGMIFVAVNYRLGALGFLSGPEVSADGTPNAGLLDQRFALEWVQRNIGLFGGDKSRVTVMGESAGGGSLLAHLAAQGKKGAKKLFAGVIAQSPAFTPLGIAPPSAFDSFLKNLGVKDLTEARNVNESKVIEANAATIGAAPPAAYLFGPVVDGNLIPESLGNMYRQGQFDKSIPVLAAHNSLEGGFFFDPNLETETEFQTWINGAIPGLGAERLSYLAGTLYPPIFDGSLGYLNQSMRQMTLMGEAIFDCNFNVVGEAGGGKRYAYQFDISPGIHIQDLRYTFGSPSAPATFAAAQDDIQEAIVSFVTTGVPKLASSGQAFPTWGENRNMVRIGEDGGHVSRSEVNQTRCAWWTGLSPE